MNKVLIVMITLYVGLAFTQVDLLLQDIKNKEQDLTEAVKKSTTVAVKTDEIKSDVKKKKYGLKLHESYYRLWLSLALIFSSTAFLVIILKYVKDVDKETLVTVVGLILVIQGSLYIVTASISSEALTAAIGLLAAVGGYVLRGVGDKFKEEKG